MSARATTPAGRRRAAARAVRPAAARRSAERKPAPRKPAPKAPKRTATRAPRRPIARPQPRGSLPASVKRRRALVWARLAVVAAAALAIGYFAWFRDSSLVAVRDVTIKGLSGGTSSPAAAALARAGRGMTTLDVDQGRLDSAAAAYPEIASVTAHPSFPHGLEIDVVERLPVLLIHAGSDAVPVAADGAILRAVALHSRRGIPSITVDRIPAGPRLGGTPLAEARVVGAAPRPLRREIDDVTHTGSDGVIATMRGGIDLRFGAASGARQKWAAAAAVLADPHLTAAQYVDVRVPERPAIG